MNKEYIKYATDMSIVGNKILKITNSRFRKNLHGVKTKEELKNIYLEFGKGAKEYRDCLSDLRYIEVPLNIKDEHMKVIQGIEMLVKGSNLLSKAIDIDKGCIDTEKIESGLKLQNEAGGIVKKEVENICNIFGI